MHGKRIYALSLSALLSLSLLGCNGTRMMADHERSVARMQAMAQQAAKTDKKLPTTKSIALPEAVDRALSSEEANKKKRHWKRFDIAVHAMPVRQFFTHLSSFDSVNIVVSPGVTGEVTLNLTQVTLPDVLSAISEGYGFRIERREFGYKIVKKGLVTRIYTIDWLALTRSGASNMNINDVQGVSSTSSDSTATSSSTSSSASSQVETHFGDKNYWQEITASIKQIIGAEDLEEGGDTKKGKKTRKGGASHSSVTINQANGLVVVRAAPAAQHLVLKYLKSLHALTTKQVVIDARILEVSLTKDQKVGVTSLGIPFLKWENSGTASTLTYANDPSNAGDTTLKNFTNIMNTLSTVGHVSLLSSPRISILNNQKALIKVGEDEYYSMGNTTTYLASSTSSTDSIQSNNLQSFFSGVALDVTPQVSIDNKITMHIHPIVSSISAVQTSVGGSTLDLPKTKIRETDTIVSTKSGQIIVIGGLISEESDLLHNKVPGFEGAKYNSNRKDSYYKKELFILLRARIVDDKSWVKELDQVSSHLRHSEENAVDL